MEICILRSYKWDVSTYWRAAPTQQARCSLCCVNSEYFKFVLKPKLDCILAKVFFSFLPSKRQRGGPCKEPGTRQSLGSNTGSGSQNLCDLADTQALNLRTPVCKVEPWLSWSWVVGGL